MNLYFVDAFQRKFSFFNYFIYEFLNLFGPVWFDQLQSCFKFTVLKIFLSSVIFIFSNVFNGFKFRLQARLFLKLNATVRSKSISNSCNT